MQHVKQQVNRWKKATAKARASAVAIVCAIALVTGGVALAPKEAQAETWGEYLERMWTECVNDFNAMDKTTGLPAWDGSASTQPSGSGTAADPYIVKTPAELRWVAVSAPAANKSFTLANDIDLGGKEWTPIVIPNTGEVVINGNNHTIYNLSLTGGTSASASGPGKAFVSSANNENFTMKDLTFRFASVLCNTGTGNYYNASVAVAWLGAGKLQHVGVEDSIVRGTRFVGAMCNGWDNGRSAVDSSGNLVLSSVKTFIDQCRTVNCYTYGSYCIGNFAGPLRAAYVTNSFAVDGRTISTGGHSGGFVSCPGFDFIENCFCNITMYGNEQTSVFSGVNHYSNGFKNCYSSGVLEGSNLVGGFSGDGSTSGTNASPSIYTNCYSTTMVGMQSTASNMGGFIGRADANLTIEGCYSAGEVGALKTENNSASVAGFIGTPSSCKMGANYFDMQTSSMRDHGAGNTSMAQVGSSDVKVGGLTTKQITGIGALANMKGFDTSAWLAKEGVYPQLKVFANPTTFHPDDQALVKAYSLASVCTAMLYPSSGDFDIPASDLVKELDTVRSIRYMFPFTNDSMVKDDSFAISWQADDIKSEVLAGTPVITLNPSTYAVSSLAPGVGWTTVEVKYFYDDADPSKYVTGTRRLRLVPTTTLSVATAAGVDHTAYVATADARPLDPAKYLGHMTYDHRDGVKFSMGDVFELADGKLKSENFPAGQASFEKVALTTVGGFVNVMIDKQEGDDWVPCTLTDDFKALMLSERRAELGDLGLYRLTYHWYASGQEGGAYLESVKYLSISETFSVTYMQNDESLEKPARTPGAQAEGDGVFYYDPGAYVPGDTVEAAYFPGNAGAEAENPTTPGYDFQGWNSQADGTGTAFDATTPIEGDTVVYATWTLQDRKASFNANGGTLATGGTTTEPEDYKALDKVNLPANPTREDYSFMGWATSADADRPNWTADDQLWDEDVTLYAVWKKNPEIKFTAEVERITDPESPTIQVGDLLKNTLTAENVGDPDSLWDNVVITGELPEGVTLQGDTIKLVAPDGTETALDPADVYDPETRTLRVPVGGIDGGDQYKLVFETKVNPTALEDGKGEILVKGEGEGSNPDGSTTLPAADDDKRPEPVVAGDPEPQVDIQVTNKTRGDGEEAQVGDELEFTVTATNTPPGTSWNDVELTVKVPDGITLDPGSIELRLPDGSTVKLDPKDVWDPETGTLRVPVGDIPGGKDATLVYKGTINDAVNDEDAPWNRDIGSLVTATGKTPENKTEGAGAESNRVWPTGWAKYAAPEPKVSKTVTNLTRTEGYAVADMLEYTLEVANGMPGTHWTGVIVSDAIPDGLRVNPDNIKLVAPDGTVGALEGAYDEASRTIAVPLEDVAGGETWKVIYQAELYRPENGGDVVNGVVATGDGEYAESPVIGNASVTIPFPSDPSDLPAPGPGNEPQQPGPTDNGPSGPSLANTGNTPTLLAATADPLTAPVAAVATLALVALAALRLSRRRS